ncbi:MAG: LysE family transporter [Burkholderiaceae bacterium]|nr:LysE family transporter [Burkholderiaceae bacterium]
MLSTLATIWLLHAAALLSPGPNVLLISQLAAGDKAQSARYAALGVTAGAVFWVSCALLGVNVVFQIFPGLRLALQIAGGAYLLHLGLRLWRASGPALQREAASLPRLSAFRLGFLTNITNPKSALFFASVFAAAFPASPSPTLQLSAAAIVVFNAFVWHMLLAYLFSRRRVREVYGRARGLSNRVAAGAFGVMGLGLIGAAVRDGVGRGRSL